MPDAARSTGDYCYTSHGAKCLPASVLGAQGEPRPNQTRSVQCWSGPGSLDLDQPRAPGIKKVLGRSVAAKDLAS